MACLENVTFYEEYLYSKDYVWMCTHSLNLPLLLGFAGVENLGILSIGPGLLLSRLARFELMTSPLRVSRLCIGVMIAGVALPDRENQVK